MKLSKSCISKNNYCIYLYFYPYSNSCANQSPVLSLREGLGFMSGSNYNWTSLKDVTFCFFSFSLSTPTAARPYVAEFYFDTPNPIRILKGSNYSYNLQWTQKEPNTTDKVIGYWITVQQVTYDACFAFGFYRGVSLILLKYLDPFSHAFPSSSN